MASQRLQGRGGASKIRGERPMSVMTKTKVKNENWFVELVRLLVHAGIIALVIRTFLFQPFNIPSGSMKATLLVGDYLFVSKYSYGFSRYSLPFINPSQFTGRIFGSQPERGDIVVFRLPADDSTDYIKRVIGLPGDQHSGGQRSAAYQRHADQARADAGFHGRSAMPDDLRQPRQAMAGNAAQWGHLRDARLHGSFGISGYRPRSIRFPTAIIS